MRRSGLAFGTACVTFRACGLAAAGPHADPCRAITVLSWLIEGGGGTALFVGRADGSGAIQITSGPSEPFFKLGRTRVTCSSIDGANTAKASFTVTVRPAT